MGISSLWLFLTSLTVLGTIFYNFSVKLAGESINAFVFTVILTAVALVGHLSAFGINKAFFNPGLKFEFMLLPFLLAAIAGIGVVIIDLAYFYAVKQGGLAITNMFWTIGGLIATVSISALFFHEPMNWQRIAGLVLGLVAIILIVRS